MKQKLADGTEIELPDPRKQVIGLLRNLTPDEAIKASGILCGYTTNAIASLGYGPKKLLCVATYLRQCSMSGMLDIDCTLLVEEEGQWDLPTHDFKFLLNLTHDEMLKFPKCDVCCARPATRIVEQRHLCDHCKPDQSSEI